MSRVSAIALNTFREAIRNKILYVLLLFAAGLILFTLVLGQMSLSEEARVTRDVGLGGIALISILISIFVGVSLVYKELDRKTVFVLIPKPLHRWEFILGKFLGMAATVAVMMAIMSALLFGVLALQDGLDNPAALARAIVLLYAQVVVMTAVAILFSSFSTPLLSGAFTLGIFAIGRSSDLLRELIERVGSSGLRALLSGALRLFPDLHLFYVSGSMLGGQRVSVHGDYVDWSYVATASGYGAAYAACALALAMLLFSRRDFV
jgi:ABC-type transport system involved in multi-copper enzyme maturation permease subunit